MNPVTMDALRTLNEMLAKETDYERQATIKKIVGKLLDFMDRDIDAVLAKNSALLK